MDSAEQFQKPSEPHPIVDILLGLLVKGEKEKYDFAESSQRALSKVLSVIQQNDSKDSADLKSAIFETVLFAHFLDKEENCFEASKAIIKVIEELALTLKQPNLDAKKMIDQAFQEQSLRSVTGQNEPLENINKAVPEGALKWWEMKRNN